MKFVLALACLVVAATAVERLSEEHNTFLFTKWMQEHQKTYERSELLTRFGNFKENLHKIRQHDEEFLAGQHTYSLKMNQFGDISSEEFGSQFNGFKPRSNDFAKKLNTMRLKVDNLAASQDWVGKHGQDSQNNLRVTPVKNQGQCGSCWSFSTTGGIEGACSVSGAGWPATASCADTGVDNFCGLSEQQLVDCSTAEGNMGCNGGLMNDAFEYVIKTGGLTTEKNYPYTATGPNTCALGNDELYCPVKAYKNVPVDEPEQMAAFLNQGPVSVAIQANQFSFQFYGGGVMTGACGTQLDHGVLVVGYGELKGEGFWKVKNSWGATWGESGFILLGASPKSAKSTYNNGAGQCGILNSASVPCMDAECSVYPKAE
jgi:C1A family cysteine protease